MAQTFMDDSFQQHVIDASKDKPVLVDFFASWCGPCQMQTPIIEKLADSMGDKAVIGKMSTEDNQETPMKYGVMSIPTLLIFKGGEVVEQFIGLQQADVLQGALEKHME